MASQSGPAGRPAFNRTRNLGDAEHDYRRKSAAFPADAVNVRAGLIDDPKSLGEMVEREILPRLLVAHSAVGPVRPSPIARGESSALTREEIRGFVAKILDVEVEMLLQQIEAMLARGVRVESIFVDLLAPTARKLGEYWEDDSCDFVDVTMGLWRLQELMREIALLHPVRARGNGQMRSALFAPMPGDQHSFGALMLEEFFARAGWDSEVLPETARPQLLQICSEHAFDLVGLTVSTDCHSGDIANLVTAIRSVSQLPGIKVIIGGQAVQADPSLVERTGADGTAGSAETALALADRLVPLPAFAG